MTVPIPTASPTPRRAARLRFVAAAVLGVALSPLGARAQPCAEPAWTMLAPAGAGVPSPRDTHAMAFDSARGVAVLYGGDNGVNVLGDTWEWNGTAWTQRVVVGPGPRRLSAMAFDAARGVVILFGGFDGTNTLADTWEYNGAAWTPRAPATSPSARRNHAMTYDSARQRVVVFGGLTSTGSNVRDYWEWDGTTWTMLANSGPSGRRDSAIAYDSARGLTVMFGGRLSTGAVNGDTWEFNPATPAWTQRVIAAPAARANHRMAFDAARGVAVLFGGVGFADTWELSAAGWAQRVLVPSPSTRGNHAMAYDSARHQVVLFGGIDALFAGDTWGIGLPAPASITIQPADVSRAPGEAADFSVAASGAAPLSFQWFRGVDLLTDGPTGTGSTLSGATTAALAVAGVGPADAGTYTCAVSNACGGDTSGPAVLTVSCPADFDGDGVPTIGDIFAMLAAWFALEPRTDFNHSGGADIGDIFLFLALWFAGCP